MTVKTLTTPLRWGEAAAAALLLLAFFLPWLTIMGASVSALGIRDQLEGPHRLVSAFTRESRVTFNYSISLWLKLLPLATATLLIPALWRRARLNPWARAARPLAAILCGAGAVAAFFYLRSEAAAFPLVDLAYGAGLAACAGAALAAIAAARMVLLLKE